MLASLGLDPGRCPRRRPRCPAGSSPGRRWPRSCSARSTSCCSTNRPTTSTSRPDRARGVPRRPRRRPARRLARPRIPRARRRPVIELDEFTHEARCSVAASRRTSSSASARRRPRGRRTRSTTARAGPCRPGQAGEGVGPARRRPGNQRRPAATSPTSSSAPRTSPSAQGRGAAAAKTLRALDRLDAVEDPREPWDLRLRLAPSSRSGTRSPACPRRSSTVAGSPSGRSTCTSRAVTASRLPGPTARARRRCWRRCWAVPAQLRARVAGPQRGRRGDRPGASDVRRRVTHCSMRSARAPVGPRSQHPYAAREVRPRRRRRAASGRFAVAGRAHPRRPGSADGPARTSSCSTSRPTTSTWRRSRRWRRRWTLRRDAAASQPRPTAARTRGDQPSPRRRGRVRPRAVTAGSARAAGAR